MSTHSSLNMVFHIPFIFEPLFYYHYVLFGTTTSTKSDYPGIHFVIQWVFQYSPEDNFEQNVYPVEILIFKFKLKLHLYSPPDLLGADQLISQLVNLVPTAFEFQFPGEETDSVILSVEFQELIQLNNHFGLDFDSLSR